MMEFTGISASPGIARGKALLFLEDKLTVPRYDIEASQVDFEYERFLVALGKAAEEVEGLATGRDATLFEAQLLMFEDPELKSQVRAELDRSHHNVEWTLLSILEQFSAKMEAAESQYLRERSVDLSDAGKRIISQLLHRKRARLSDLSQPIILVTHNLMPSDTLGLRRGIVLGIATDVGGKTSHTAILARSHEIPAVLGLSDISRHVANDAEVIVDGNRGVVIVSPDAPTREVYNRRRKDWERKYVVLKGLKELPAETLDGKRIAIEANIEAPEEAHAVLAHGADSIGLFRSEFLFLQPNRFPSEEEQYQAYTLALTLMAGRSVTIRTLDLGGDKLMPGVPARSGRQPASGLAGHPVLPGAARDHAHPASGASSGIRPRGAADHVSPGLRRRGAGAHPGAPGGGQG